MRGFPKQTGTSCKASATLNDRIMKQTILALILSALLTACSQPASSKYNLVMICIDTVRADNFWSLAADHPDDELSVQLNSALRYLSAHSSSPWTIPTIASVFTGLYPRQHGAGYFSEAVANLDIQIPSQLDTSMTTLAEVLSDQEFETAAFPAHPWITADYGLQQGFQTMRPGRGWEKINRHFFDLLQSQDDSRDEPFFAYLHYMEAHDWHLKPKRERNALVSGLSAEQLALAESYTQSTACSEPGSLICQRNKIYVHAIQTLRQAVADVYRRLDEAGLLDDTIIVLFADHGEEFWDHRAEAIERNEDPRGIYGFGHGQSMYQELLRVPLAIWHPDFTGREIREIVSLVDLFPSILDWLNVDHDSNDLPGHLLPVADQNDTEPRIIYASGNSFGPQKIATREGNKKAIWHLRTDQQEFFDLDRDPGEKLPRQDDQWLLRSDTLLGDYLELESLTQAATPQLSQSQLEHLKSIGYLQGLDEQDLEQANQEETDPDDERDSQ